MTRNEAIEAVQNATAIYVQPRMGVSERWVKIAKREAEYLLRGLEKTGEVDAEIDCHPNGEVYLS